MDQPWIVQRKYAKTISYKFPTLETNQIVSASISAKQKHGGTVGLSEFERQALPYDFDQD